MMVVVAVDGDVACGMGKQDVSAWRGARGSKQPSLSLSPSPQTHIHTHHPTRPALTFSVASSHAMCSTDVARIFDPAISVQWTCTSVVVRLLWI